MAMTFTKQEVERAKDKDLKIWVIGTREDDFNIDESSLCVFYKNCNIDISKYPEVYKKFITTKEYEEDNINQYSKYFNEFVGMYYVWKNKKSKYVAFCHYRRLLPLNYIDFDELDKDKIQYFSIWRNYEHPTGHLTKDILSHKYTYFYELICKICVGASQMYEDIETYFNKQTVLSQESLKDYHSYEKYYVSPAFISRNIFACKWEVFDKMMQFLSGFFESVLKTHNINSEQSFRKFYTETYVEYLKKNFGKIKDKYYNYMYSHDKEKDYVILHKKDSGYNETMTPGFWRWYAFIIEEMVSAYIIITKGCAPIIIEEHESYKNELFMIYELNQLIEKEKSNNFLVFSQTDNLKKLLNYYNIKHNNTSINFFLPEIYDNKTNKTAEDKYLLNFVKNHLIDLNDMKALNKIDCVIFDLSVIQDNILNEEIENIIVNILDDNCKIIILYAENLIPYQNLIDKLNLNYNITGKQKRYYNQTDLNHCILNQKPYKNLIRNINILSLNKKGEE